MGSFAYTCAVSGLPIEVGDDVRFLLLTEDQYHESVCAMDSVWSPRTFPIRAKYNDYGSIKNYKNDLATSLYMEGLQEDLASVGVGENSCHDVATSKDMSFENLLDAVQRKRVKVYESDDLALKAILNKKDNLSNSPKLPKTPIGIPTMQRVKKILIKNGFVVVNQGFTDNKSYILSKIKRGMIKIRLNTSTGAYDKDVQCLKLIQGHLDKEYVTVISAGDQDYTAKMLVFPKPGTKGYSEYKWLKRNPLLVTHCMIREDVWQEIINTPLEVRYPSKKSLTIDDYRKFVSDTYKMCLKFLSEVDSDDVWVYNSLKNKLNNDYETNPVAPWLSRGKPMVIGFADHFHLLLEKKLPIEDVKDLLNDIAEFIYVMNYLMSLRFYWQPSNSCGPQCGEWKAHKAFLNSLSKIVKNTIAKHKANGY